MTVHGRLIKALENINYKPYEGCATDSNLANQFSKYALNCIVDEFLKNDIEPVVRCKYCTEWDEKERECSHWYGFRENDFCSYGERRDT